MKVGVDRGRCQGHARCEAISEFFTLDDDGYSTIGDGLAVPDAEADQVRLAVETCPEGALFLRED